MIVTIFAFYGFRMYIKLIFRILKVTSLWSIGFVMYYLGFHHHHFCCPPLSYPISLSFTDLDLKFVLSLLNSLHVDNLNSGAYTIGEALEFFMKCKEGLALGGFNMRKFQSNSKELENLVVQKLH